MKLFPFKLVNVERLETEILNRVDDALSAHVEARKGFDDPLSFSDKVSKENLFNAFFSKARIHNQDVKDILLGSLENVPDVDLSFEELWSMQDACWIKYSTDTIIQGVVDSYTDYIIGTGIVLDTPVQEVTDALNAFRKINKMNDKEKEIVKSAFLDGEYFFLLFFNSKGDIILRKAHPRTIEAIETAPGDLEVPYSYKQRYTIYDDQGNPTSSHRTRFIEDINYEDIQKLGFYNPGKHARETNKNIRCMHLKFNDADKMRGLPPLSRILKWVKIYENFIMDRMVLNHERSKVVWIKTFVQRTKDAMNKLFRAPEGGTMLIERDGIKYRAEKANLDSSEAKEDALGLLYYIGSGIRFPLHILNQRTDQQVYASIRKADMPFVKMIESSQTMYAQVFEEVYRFVLTKLVKAGKLKKTYSYDAYSEESLLLSVDRINRGILNDENAVDIKNAVDNILEVGKSKITVNTVEIPVSQDFQQLIWQDPKEMAEVLKIHTEMGITSLATASGKAGYTWKKEYPKIMAEAQVKLAMAKAEMEATTPPEPKQVVEKTKPKPTPKE